MFRVSRRREINFNDIWRLSGKNHDESVFYASKCLDPLRVPHHLANGEKPKTPPQKKKPRKKKHPEKMLCLDASSSLWSGSQQCKHMLLRAALSSRPYPERYMGLSFRGVLCQAEVIWKVFSNKQNTTWDMTGIKSATVWFSERTDLLWLGSLDPVYVQYYISEQGGKLYER